MESAFAFVAYSIVLVEEPTLEDCVSYIDMIVTLEESMRLSCVTELVECELRGVGEAFG